MKKGVYGVGNFYPRHIGSRKASKPKARGLYRGRRYFAVFVKGVEISNNIPSYPPLG